MKTHKLKSSLLLYCNRDEFRKIDKLLCKRGYKLWRIQDISYYNNYRVEEWFEVSAEYLNIEMQEQRELQKQHEQYLRTVLQY